MEITNMHDIKGSYWTIRCQPLVN